MSLASNSTTPKPVPIDAADLAQSLDRWLRWRTDLQRAPKRIALTGAQLDALDAIGMLEWSYFDFPSRTSSSNAVHERDRPFYRGYRVVIATPVESRQ